MGKQVDQGTRFETRLRKIAEAVGRASMRMPKTGKKDEPDLMIAGLEMRPAVAWERWIKKPGQRRRAVRMWTVTEEHMAELLALDTEGKFGYLVQCKSTQAGSLSSWLEGLIERMRQDA